VYSWPVATRGGLRTSTKAELAASAQAEEDPAQARAGARPALEAE